MWENPRNVEAAIKRLTREIDEFDRYFYGRHEQGDRVAYAGMLERKRDDMVRSAVLQLHTAIEDMLNAVISRLVTGHRRPSLRNHADQAVRKMLFGGGSLGFEMKLNLAVALRLVSNKTRNRLTLMNSLRNKYSHNWVLNVAVRQGRRPAQRKMPLLVYDGRNLHNVDVLKDFVSEYGDIYAKLFSRFVDLEKSGS